MKNQKKRIKHLAQATKALALIASLAHLINPGTPWRN